MPAEWEPHARTYMAWTGDQMVATRLETAVKVDYGLVAKEIVRFEPLTVVVEPGFKADAAAYCPGAEILEHSLEDSYLRDSGPLFTRKADGTLAAVDFLFNGWGAGEPLGTVGKAIADHARVEHQPVPLVLEGGSISTNGEGTLIAVEPTVLHANRNLNATRALFEAAFAQFLGIERTIWLEHGLLEDRTGGHVDNVAAFIGPNRVACQTAQPPDPNHASLERNREQLERAGLDNHRAADRLPRVGGPQDRAAVREFRVRQRWPDRAARTRIHRPRSGRNPATRTARPRSHRRPRHQPLASRRRTTLHHPAAAVRHLTVCHAEVTGRFPANDPREDLCSSRPPWPRCYWLDSPYP